MKTGGVRLLVLACMATILGACGGGGGGGPTALPVTTSAPMTATQSPNLANTPDLQGVATNLAGQQRPDGGIFYTTTTINPYFANIAAIGAVHGGVDLINVQRWMQWYVARSTDANPWSLPGAITDYNVAPDGSLSSTGTADSVDAYAATFLSLAAAAWREGDGPLRAYVTGLRSDIERIASTIDALSDADGLTWALPTYHVKYVMDNSEVYQGLVDLAFLRSQAFGDLAGSVRAAAHALRVQTSIQTQLWDPARGAFAVAVDSTGTKTWPKAGDWQDGTAQLFPILHGVVTPTSASAQTAYNRFSSAFPGWPNLRKPDPYPWVSVAFVALQMNDVSRAATYASTVAQQYAPGFSYPWYCAESGWYVRLLLGLTTPLTVASL